MKKVNVYNRSVCYNLICSRVRFACDDCSNCYPCLKSLNNHVRDVHRPSANIISPEELPSDDDDDDNDDNISVVSSYYDAETKVFSCPHCQKTYKKNWQLKTHLYDHTGVLPFRCKHDGCERAFLIRSHLKRHVKQGDWRWIGLYRCVLVNYSQDGFLFTTTNFLTVQHISWMFEDINCVHRLSA